MLKRYLLIAAGVLLLFFVPLSVSSAFRDATVRLIKPVGRFFTTRSESIQNFWLNLKEIGSIRENKKKLQEQVIALQQQVIDSEELQRENEDLRNELGISGVTREMPKVAAHIVLQSDNPLDYSFTIDVGRAHGVEVGQPAVAQGALIGRVTEVREQTSVVRSVTSLESRIQAWLSSSQEKGFLVGTGNAVQLQDITQGLTIEPATVVETSGLGGSLPQGILIGSIAERLSVESELTQTFRVDLAVDPLSIQSLFVLLTDQP